MPLAEFAMDTWLSCLQPDGVPPYLPAEERSISTVTQDINVLALVKGSERYIFLYDDDQRSETLRAFGRFASNPELSFTWYDAAVLSQKLRKEAQKVGGSRRFNLPQPSDSDDF